MTAFADDLIWIVDLCSFWGKFCNDNFLVVFCKMDYEGHLLNVNKVFTIFFFGKKQKLMQIYLVII